MTQLAFPSSPVDESTAALLELIASDWRFDDGYQRFVAALRRAVRDHGVWVSQNSVRPLLTNEHGMTINPRHYSGMFRQACKDGLLEWRSEAQFWDINDDARSRNRGKPQRRYLWVGER